MSSPPGTPPSVAHRMDIVVDSPTGTQHSHVHTRAEDAAAAAAATTTGNESDSESAAPVLPLAADSTSVPAPVASPEKRKTTARTRTAAAAAAAAASAADGAAAPAPAAASKKRKLAFGSSEPAAAAAPQPPSREDSAAARIQALVRGAKARSAHKQGVLWRAWNLLDWKEEQALMNSHSAYEALKAAVTTRISKEGKDDAAAASSPKGSKKRAASPAPAAVTKKGSKKGRKPSLSAEDEESACGLLLRDKDPLTFTWVSALMEHFRQNKQLPQSLVYKLLARAEPLLRALPNVVEVSCTARLTIVGDLHGQLDDLLHVFKLMGCPSARNRFLFNGDFVDRGQHSVECILTLLAWKVLMPNDVFLNRGNHEARDINGRDGFERECLQKYANDVGVFDRFSAVFATLPLAHIIDSQVLVVHGGLFPGCPSIADIQKEDRFHEVPPSESLMEWALWSDPKQAKGRSESPRGAGLLFGPDVTKEFLAANNLQLIVRSHECMSKGFKMHHHDTVITVFSASNYCGTVGNDGGLIVFERDGETALTAPRTPKASGRPSSPAMGVPASQPPPLRSPRLAARELAAPTKESSGSSSSSAPVQLKRRCLTFYAAAKEKQSAYRVVGGSNLESDIISKLLHIISDHRLHLTDHWGKHSQQHSTGVRTVTRAVWAAGLKSVLGLSLPFHEFQDLLGLPKLGIDGKAKGSIDYMAFLARFRPVNLVVLRAQQRARDRAASQSQSQSLEPTQETQEPPMDDYPEDDASAAISPSDEAALAPLRDILELLHKNRFELESLFRYLDYDGDESISHQEFREGIKALEGQLGATFTRAQMDSLLSHIDVDGDGQISYAEFLNSFELEDPSFQTHLLRSRSIREARSGPTGLAVRVDSGDAATAAAAAAVDAILDEATTDEESESKEDVASDTKMAAHDEPTRPLHHPELVPHNKGESTADAPTPAGTTAEDGSGHSAKRQKRSKA